MKILVADDDDSIADAIHAGLVDEGFSVDCVYDGRDALNQSLHRQYDLLILDRMMPGLNGLEVLKALRACHCHIPVIFLSALSDVDDRVEGLKAGSDDYLSKPFALSELLARISVVLRRPGTEKEPRVLQVHDLTLDLMTRTAKRGDVNIALKPREFAMLEMLMRKSGAIVTRTMLLEHVWHINFDPHTTVVETHISRLRAKIDKPFDVPLLHTRRNTGYSLYADI